MSPVKITITGRGSFSWNIEAEAQHPSGAVRSMTMTATVYGSHRRALKVARRLEDRLRSWVTGIRVLPGGQVTGRAVEAFPPERLPKRPPSPPPPPPPNRARRVEVVMVHPEPSAPKPPPDTSWIQGAE